MIFSSDEAKRRAVLKKLKIMQKKDFTDLFTVMAGKEVNIRLLDAPLHEFLPHNSGEKKEFIQYMKQSTGKNFTEKDLQEKSEALREFNRCLGTGVAGLPYHILKFTRCR